MGKPVVAASPGPEHRLPHPPVRNPADEFVNEIAPERRKFFESRHHLVTRLPNGVVPGNEPNSEMYLVKFHMKRFQRELSSSVPVYAEGVGVYVRYDSLTDAHAAGDLFRAHGFEVEFVPALEFGAAKGQVTAQLNAFEGQIKVSVMIQPISGSNFQVTDVDHAEITRTVRDVGSAFGSVRNCIHVDTPENEMTMVYRVEFDSIDAANRAVGSLGLGAVYGINAAQTFRWAFGEAASWPGKRGLGRLPYFEYHPHLTFDGRGHPFDSHNAIRRDRIINGSDVRTTIMLRNLPNKMDWMELKGILDEYCFGTYDFVYVRIDFKSSINVGYAFINFVDVRGMLAVIDCIEHRRWTHYHSVKYAEISYATIQGREALVQKFRNSSVMVETPFCRPRLFCSYPEADECDNVLLAGIEQKFPDPDNLSKLQRSIDSARSTGLYNSRNRGYASIIDRRNRGVSYGTPPNTFGTPQYHSAASQYAGIHPLEKRAIEVWYSNNFGQGTRRNVPFEYIPLEHANTYFAMQQMYSMSDAATSPGAIGAPVGNNAT